MLDNFIDDDIRNGIATAVYNDDGQAVARHALTGADVNARDSNNITLLQHAVLMKNRNAVHALLNVGASFSLMGGPSGYTAAHFAVYTDQPDMLDLIFAKEPGCLSVRDNSLQTPLHLAVYMGKISAVERLLILGADTALTNAQQQSVFDIVKERCLEAVEHEADPTLFIKIHELLQNPPPRKLVVIMSPEKVTADTGLVTPADASPQAQLSAFERNQRALEKLRTFKPPGF
jgi:hypothetical protein